MPFRLRKLFSRNKNSVAASIRAETTRTQVTTTTHWNEKARTFEATPTMPSNVTNEEVRSTPELLALAIFHSMPQSSDNQRTAEWLGEVDPQRARVLKEFLRLFNWNGESVVQAFRSLCTRVQLKGESQHLDRVVDAFAKRWIECNQHHAFISQGVVYTIAYSILLLNTDLHTKVDTNKTNMTMKQYVKYVTESLTRLFQTERPQFSKVTDYSAFLESQRPSITSFVADNRNYARAEWFQCISGVLRLFYRSIAQCPLVIPDDFQMKRQQTNTEKAETTASASTRRNSISTFGSTAIAEEREIAKFGDQDAIDRLRLLGAPWSKEGPLKFQYFQDVESGIKKQHKSEWSELFAFADGGQMRLYRLRNRNAAQQGTTVGDGNWMSQAQLVHAFVLTNALAQSADQSENPGEWSLLLSGDRLLRFRTGSPETAAEYVYTCNYWAARLSKPPLVEMVSSTEYGWSRPVEITQGRRDLPAVYQGSGDSIVIGDERIPIFEWKNRQASEMHSSLSETEQLNFLEEYVANIDSELANHSMVLGDMLRIFMPRFAISARAHANWEARSQFLLKETVQYTTYCKTLMLSIEDGKQKLESQTALGDEHEELADAPEPAVAVTALAHDGHGPASPRAEAPVPAPVSPQHI